MKMIYRTKGSMVRIGVEHKVSGRKKPVLTIRDGVEVRVIASFTNEEAAKDFEKTFEQFIRGAIIEDREIWRKKNEIRLNRTDDIH